MKEIHMFDFDGTLFDTPSPEVGKKIWKEKFGLDWEHIGWWGRSKTIDPNIFDIKPIKPVLDIYKSIKDKAYKVFLATGRLERVKGMRENVETVLDSHDIEMDGVFLSNGDTFKFKRKLFEDIIKQYKPDKFVMYDDRESHIKLFKEWSELYKTDCEIIIVDVNEIIK